MKAKRRSNVLELRPDEDRDGAIKRLASIDIGSNSIRMIVADVSPDGRIRIVDEMKSAPRLGSGVDREGVLSEQAMRHAVESLARMSTLAKRHGASRIDAVATSAVRDAVNARGFLDNIRRECGLRVRVLEGADEARLAYRSALAHFDLAGSRTVVMDIGGGSLELALSADGLLERLESFPFGAIRVTEQFLGNRPTRKDVRRLRKHIRGDIRTALPLKDWRGATLICSGGTFTNLAGMHLYRRGHTSAAGKVHGTAVPREELEHIIELLHASTAEERAQIRGLNPGRQDIILGGLVVAAEVMARIEARELIVSAYGIREGSLLEAANITATPADPGEARERSVLRFAERCHYEAPHAQQVRKLALQLFDALGRRLGLDESDRNILGDAALLHDVGYHINYRQHHKHSYHLIMHADLLGIPPEDQVMIANVARYHRGAVPKLKHEGFTSLPDDARWRVNVLSAFLRIADGLDRGHVSGVQRVKVRWTERAIRITAVPHPRAKALRLELWGGARKSALLAEVAECPVELIGPDGRVVTSSERD